jgi:hypothetical protein
VIRVAIPIDVGTVAVTGCQAFALATPLRLDEILRMAVSEALGPRAPLDKLERSVRTTLAGLHARKFVVDVNGRLYDDAGAVVVCSGFATLRFFSTEPRRRRMTAG